MFDGLDKQLIDDFIKKIIENNLANKNISFEYDLTDYDNKRLIGTTYDCPRGNAASEKWSDRVLSDTFTLVDIITYKITIDMSAKDPVYTNNYAVILEPTIHRLNIDQLGKLFNQPAYFPKGINVSIAHIDNPSNATLHVYERGVGQTQACGTAACAVMALGHHLEKLTSSAQIHQPGGSLNISWKGHGTDIIMQGEACYVFDGQWS